MRAVHPQRSSYVLLSLMLVVFGLFSLMFGAIGVTPAQAQSAPTTLSGYVFSWKGDFLPGATVTLYAMPAHTAAAPATTSDAKGGWHLDVGPGTYAVQATAPGYEFDEQTVYATSFQTGITFIMRPPGTTAPQPLVATVSGRVYSLDNVPLGGMNIIATNARDNGVRQQAPPPTLSATVTNPDGTYSLRVPAGTIWMTLKSGADWGYQRDPVAISAGQTLTGADFVPAIRVLPRTSFPTPTLAAVAPAAPTFTSGVAPIIGGNPIVMPQTGNSGGDGFSLLLAGLGLLAVLAGGLLTLAGRARRA